MSMGQALNNQLWIPFEVEILAAFAAGFLPSKLRSGKKAIQLLDPASLPHFLPQDALRSARMLSEHTKWLRKLPPVVHLRCHEAHRMPCQSSSCSRTRHTSQAVRARSAATEGRRRCRYRGSRRRSLRRSRRSHQVWALASLPPSIYARRSLLQRHTLQPPGPSSRCG